MYDYCKFIGRPRIVTTTHSYYLDNLLVNSELPVRLPGELRSSPPEIRGALGPRLCFKTLIAVGVLT